MSAVKPADEVNKEMGESVSDCSVEMRGGKWPPGEMERRNPNWGLWSMDHRMVYVGMKETM